MNRDEMKARLEAMPDRKAYAEDKPRWIIEFGELASFESVFPSYLKAASESYERHNPLTTFVGISYRSCCDD